MITIVLIILLLCACGDCAAQSGDTRLEQVANTTDNGNDDFVEFVRLSQMAQQNGDISQAIEYGKRAKQVFNDNHLPENENYCFLNLMICSQYISLKDLVSAYPYMKEAYEVCMRLGGSKLTYYNSVLSLYEKFEGNIAEYYLGKNEYNESLSHYLNSLQLHETLQGKDAGSAVLLNNIGQVYEKTGDYENAEKYTYQALRINRE